MIEGEGRSEAVLGTGFGIKVQDFEAAGMSREGSPDWLRTFEVPITESVLSLSSDSKSSLKREDDSDGREPTPRKSSESDDDDKEVICKFIGKIFGSSSHKELKGKLPEKGETVEEHVPREKKKLDGSKKREGEPKAVVEKPLERNELNDSVLALSSDSEPENSPPRENDGESLDLKMSQLQSRGNSEDAAVMGISEESPSKQASKGKPLKKSPKGKGQSPKKEKNQMDSQEKEGSSGDVEMAEKEASDKQIEPHALVECEKDSVDLSGDMGAVGRVIVSESKSGHSEMSVDLKEGFSKGTTAGTHKFRGGLAAFVESRETTNHENEKKSYKDGVAKFFLISRQSNLLYLGIGSSYKCKTLAGRLATRVKLSEFLGQHIAAEKGETIKGSVGIDDALQMAQKNLNNMAHGNPRLGTPPNERIFGGILIGQGPNKEYIAYYIALDKARRIDPVRISDRRCCACGTGGEFVMEKLNQLNVNPEGSAKMAVKNIKTGMLYACLNEPGSGGKTNVFLLLDGKDLPVNPYQIDPITAHLEDHEFLADRIILLLIAKEKAGEFDKIEQGIAAWPDVHCVTRLASGGTYWAYRIFCVDAEHARRAFEFLMLNPVPAEHQDSELSSSFDHVYAVVGSEAVESYAGMCSRDRLEFIKELEFMKGCVD